MSDKPEYRIPLMAEIDAIPWNGFNAISTFSGAGGSCLGYRMAGFHVLWANEFIPIAQETYKANHPHSILDTRDIRTIEAQDILDAIGLKTGEIDLLDGSPPCASFSTAGKREAGWGQVKEYSGTQQRVDDLFFEYARILKGLQPKTFVAENVSGLVKGKAKGYFKEILQALKDCGYRVKAKLLDAQWLGVPQRRQRIIFIGVRNDLGLEPVHPQPLPYRYSVREAIPWIAQIETNRQMLDASQNARTSILTHGRRKTANQLLVYRNKRGGFGKEEDLTNKPSSPVLATTVGNIMVVEPETSLEGYKVGELWEQLAPGQSHPERHSLHRIGLDEPSPTIMQRMANDNGKPFMGARSTHPFEKRYLSIGELKRICAFPDDFVLTGTYAQQWERLGRSVPPMMMYHIAATIRDKILCKIS